MKRALAAVPGLVLIGFPLARRIRGRPVGPGAWTIYATIATYALPYLLTAMTERYVLPAIPPVLILAGGMTLTAPRSRRPDP